MMSVIREWLTHRWQSIETRQTLQSYGVVFGGYHGQRVLQHMLDTIYCTIYEGSDPNLALVHNARRSVVQEMLENIEQARAAVQPEEASDALAG